MTKVHRFPVTVVKIPLNVNNALFENEAVLAMEGYGDFGENYMLKDEKKWSCFRGKMSWEN